MLGSAHRTRHQAARGDASASAQPRLDFAISTFGKSMPWAAADAFTLYFLTDVAGVPAVESGLFVFLFLGWNALCDPVVGWVLDRHGFDRTLRRPYFTISALLAGVFFVFSFTTPASGWPRAPWLLMGGLGFRTFYSILDVPHNAMLARLGRHGGTVGLGAMRLLAGLAGTFAIGLAVSGALGQPNVGATRAFSLYAVTVALVSTIVFLAWLPVAESGEISRNTAHGARGPEGQPFPPLAVGMALIFLSAMLAAVMTSVFSKDLIYIAKYVFNDPALVVRAMTAMTFGKLIAVPLWWWSSRRLGIIGSMVCAHLITAATGAVLAVLAPERTVFVIGMTALGVGLGGVNMLTWALLPGLANAASCHARQAVARVFGLYTALTKLAAGASGMLLGLFLAVAGVHAGMSRLHGTAHFYVAACLVPVIGGMGCVLCLTGYKILSRQPAVKPWTRSAYATIPSESPAVRRWP